jgi:hypothetical protein
MEKTSQAFTGTFNKLKLRFWSVKVTNISQALAGEIAGVRKSILLDSQVLMRQLKFVVVLLMQIQIHYML